MIELLRSICSPIDDIFIAALMLLEAAELHGAGDFSGAEQRILEADSDAVSGRISLERADSIRCRHLPAP